MRRVGRVIVLAAALTPVAAGVLDAQGRGGQNWNTFNADAQRTGWLRTETRISAATLQKPSSGGFQLLWKVKPENEARQFNTLTQPLILGNLISHKGFKALIFVGGSSDTVWAYDYDLAKVYWSQKLSTASSQPGTPACPGGLTALTRNTPLNQSAVPGAPPVPGRAAGAGSALAPGPPAARGPVQGINPNNLPIVNAVWTISGGGMVHALNPHIGTDLRMPTRLVPAGSKVIGSVLVNNTLYAVTTDSCAGAPNGVWALDVSNDGPGSTPKVWDSGDAPIAGSTGPTLGLNNVLYVAAGSGQSSYANAVVALDAQTLQVRDWFTSSSPFVSAPVAFHHGGRDLVAVVNRDGRLYVLDGTTPGGTDHRTALARSSPYSSAESATGAITTWQDQDGVRWLLVASAGPVHGDTRFQVSNGSVTQGTVAAFKLLDENGSLRLEPTWTSRDLISPATPIVLNDVVFALSTGALRTTDPRMPAAQRLQRSNPAVLYALDAKTGRELWSSGATISASVQGMGPSGQDGQVYVVAADGTLYAFGLPLER
ncbi:MAG: PQQ-binding-like beta-propeller repeat protein [Vicinamibacterales bacterium]